MALFEAQANPGDNRMQFVAAAVVLIPVIPAALVWWPELSASGMTWSSVVLVVVAYGLLAELGRRRGLNQALLLAKRWDGNQVIALLRHHDSTIPQNQKRRYRAALQSLIPGWISPSAEQEKSDTESSNAVYEEAARWVVEQTSDVNQFPLVHKQLARYSFYLDLLGLRPWLVAFGSGAVILSTLKLGSHDHSAFVANATALSALLTIVIPAFTTREVDIRDAAIEYAKSLLEALELLANNKCQKK